MLEKEKDIDDDVREEEDIVCFWKDDDFAKDMQKLKEAAVDFLQIVAECDC